jgi:hypothetical protein
MTTKYFTECSSLDEVKQLYKKLAMLHHPDRGGNKQIMQAINLEYESIRKNPSFHFWKQKEEVKLDYVEFPEIINKIIGLQGIIIELCGNWIWVSGATYKYKAQLKEAGFLFAGEKKFWYWRPHDYKSANRKPRTMDYIRNKYGSDVYHDMGNKELEATGQQEANRK